MRWPGRADDGGEELVVISGRCFELASSNGHGHERAIGELLENFLGGLRAIGRLESDSGAGAGYSTNARPEGVCAATPSRPFAGGEGTPCCRSSFDSIEPLRAKSSKTG